MPRLRETFSKSDARHCPQRAVRNQGSADREDSDDGRNAPHEKMRVCRLGQSRVRYIFYGACAVVRGRCGALPARMGSGRFRLPRGESAFPCLSEKNRFKNLAVKLLTARQK